MYVCVCFSIYTYIYIYIHILYILISPNSCRAFFAAKEMDSKSIGLCPQGFESPRCRFALSNRKL